MTRDEFQKAVDDVITDCIRNDYSFSSYARKVTDAVWPVLEAAENDAAYQKALAESALRVAEGWERKCDALRAEIAEMERQEPAGWQRLHEDGSSTEDIVDSPNVFAHQRPLYALPGAQGEEK